MDNPRLPDEPTIKHVITTIEYESDIQLNLRLIAQRVSGSTYNPGQLPAVRIRRTKPNCTINLYDSGKLVVFGLESQAVAQLAAQKALREIQRLLGARIKIKNVNVSSIFAYVTFGFKIDLKRLQEDHQALIRKRDRNAIQWKTQHVSMVRIFASGMEFLGAKKAEDIQKAYEELKGIIQQYRQSE